MEMGKVTSRTIWRTKVNDYKSTCTYSSKERRKIPNRKRYFRTCHRGSSILRTRRKMGTYHVFVKNNAISRNKLWDL